MYIYIYVVRYNLYMLVAYKLRQTSRNFNAKLLLFSASSLDNL
jgi:hypothetical protein